MNTAGWKKLRQNKGEKRSSIAAVLGHETKQQQKGGGGELDVN